MRHARGPGGGTEVVHLALLSLRPAEKQLVVVVDEAVRSAAGDARVDDWRASLDDGQRKRLGRLVPSAG